MKSLFLRIFLWFWLTIMIVGVFTVFLTLTEESGPILTLWRNQVGNALAMYGQAAAEVWVRDGKAALDEHLSELESITGAHAYLFDGRRELSGRKPSARILDFAARSGEKDAVEIEFSDETFIAGQRVRGPRGKPYLIVREMPKERVFAVVRRYFPLRDFAIRLMIMLAVVGLLSYLLARYLTSPILKLQAAVRRFAGGELNARVGEAICRRPDEIGQLGWDFDSMAERIQRLMDAQKRLLGDISHELRSPLARLNVALELARRRAGDDVQTSLDRIGKDAERLDELIGELLILVRLESGADRISRARFDLSELVRGVAADVDYEAGGRNRRVRSDIRADLIMDGNAELVRRAIENVLRNAVRYSAEATTVELELGKEDSVAGVEAVITVRDHGPGVPEAALEEMFRPFHRVADARDRSSGGIGLGLAIAEQAIRVHGGTVRAHNAAGGGLLITIRLPAELGPFIEK